MHTNYHTTLPYLILFLYTTREIVYMDVYLIFENFYHIYFNICNSLTAIYYYQEDEENDHFKRFCDTFLGRLKVKPFEFEEPVPECLLLVFFLPSANRQNNVDMVSNFLVETKNNSHFKGECDSYILVCKSIFHSTIKIHKTFALIMLIETKSHHLNQRKSKFIV